jgi:hypothetical protein
MQMKAPHSLRSAYSFLLLSLILIVVAVGTFSPECSLHDVGVDAGAGAGARKDDCPTAAAGASLQDLLCIFRKVERSSNCWPLTSSVQVKEYATVPDGQGWSRCIHCILHDNSIHIYGMTNSSFADKVQLTWSYWGEFFHTFHNDKYFGGVIPSVSISADAGMFYVDRPVYLLPMITLHAGHVLVDYLEQVYHSMMMTYGAVRKDALIVLDVAGAPERDVLQTKLSLYSEEDTFGRLLTLLTDLPLLSISSFTQLRGYIGGHVIFESLHFGTDMSASFFNKGYEYHPCIWGPLRHIDNDRFMVYSHRYKQFQEYILDALGTAFPQETLESKAKETITILFVQRSKNRRIMNMERLVSLVASANTFIETDVIDLDQTPFSQQVKRISRTDILVAAAGTAVHNMLFMKPKSAVVIVMQPGWCKWSWMYSNQAELLDQRYIIFCADHNHPAVSSEVLSRLQRLQHYSFDNTDRILPGSNSFHWTRNFWKQGPRLTKSSNITLNLSRLPAAIVKVCQQMHVGLNINAITADPVCLGDEQTTAFGYIFLSDRMVEITASGDHGGAIPITRMTGTPLLEVYVSSIELLDRGDKQNPWSMTLELMGSIVNRVKSSEQYNHIVESIQHMSICFRSVFTMRESEALCFEVNSFNYYSHLLLRIDSPVHHAHLWLQSSPTGGKIADSDCFLMIDTRIGNDGGLSIHHQAAGSVLTVPVSLLEKIRMSHPTFPRHHYLSTQLSLQRYTADLCKLASLNVVDCCRATALLTQSVFDDLQIAGSRLPLIQSLPTPKTPFLFLHIEKTAGTTLRE